MKRGMERSPALFAAAYVAAAKENAIRSTSTATLMRARGRAAASFPLHTTVPYRHHMLPRYNLRRPYRIKSSLLRFISRPRRSGALAATFTSMRPERSRTLPTFKHRTVALCKTLRLRIIYTLRSSLRAGICARVGWPWRMRLTSALTTLSNISARTLSTRL